MYRPIQIWPTDITISVLAVSFWCVDLVLYRCNVSRCRPSNNGVSLSTDMTLHWWMHWFWVTRSAGNYCHRCFSYSFSSSPSSSCYSSSSIIRGANGFQAHWQNCEKRLLALWCMSARPHGRTQLPIWRIFMKFYIWGFF